jgi:sugar porter (SP) family MFS transporter
MGPPVTTMDRLPGFNVANRLQKRSLLIAINCIAALSIFFFGYDQGMMGGVNNARDYIDLMGFGYVDSSTGDPVVTNSLLQGGIVSVYYLGTLCGCLLGGWIGDKLGRIKTIAVGSLWAILGACLQCSAQNHNWMICARAVNGIGTGILNAIVPVWATETAEHTSRGQFIAIEFTLNIFGVVVAYWLEFGLSYIDNGNSPIRWRFPIAFQIIPLFVLFGSVWFFPESPRWLVKVGRDDEAQYILRRLRGTDHEDKAAREYRDIRNIVELETRESKDNSYLRMFFGIGSGELHTGRRVQLVIWLQIIQEWVGIAGVTIYAPTIFRIAGFDATKSQWISGLNNIFYMFATLVCVFTLDRIGRRWTLYWGAVGQGIAMLLAGAFSRLAQEARGANDSDHAGQYGAAAAAFVFIFTAVFGATWLTVPWLYPAEIFPLQVQRLWRRGLEHRQWLADAAVSRHVQRHWREHAVHFWRVQLPGHPRRLGFVPGVESADARGDGPVVCGADALGLGCGADVPATEGREAGLGGCCATWQACCRCRERRGEWTRRGQ